MAEILGLGLTHYPPLARPDDKMAGLLQWTLEDPAIPEKAKDPASWPEAMRAEWGDDKGTAAAAKHREALRQGLAMVRAALDDFAPDVVVIWGDDQYENYREDVIPPFSVLAYNDVTIRPWAGEFGHPNVWDEPRDLEVHVPGHRSAAKQLVGGLLGEGFDTAYAYEPLHSGWGHAFANTVMYLDYDRNGWDYPSIAFHVNCYGRSVIVHKGTISRFADARPEDELDPPSPSPSRCYDLGRATARVLRQSPYRVALIASSSWSHAFLHDAAWRLHPDIESDRKFFNALQQGDYEPWRDVPLESIEASGQQELLNWFCLVGAMDELNQKPQTTQLVETHIFNSNKCFAVFGEN